MRKTRVALYLVTALAAGAVLLAPKVGVEASRGDTTVTSISVNGGRSILLGPAEGATVPLVLTARDGSGIASVGPIGVWGPNYGVLGVSPLECTAAGPSSTCRGTVTVRPRKHEVFDDEAGTWFVDLKVRARDGDRYVNQTAAGFSVKQATLLELAGVPERTTPGEEIRVTGRLDRASWEDHGYHGYPGGLVFLQFRAGWSSTWTTVAETYSQADGTLEATVPAAESGAFQWYYPGDKWVGDSLSRAVPVSVG
ncbi:hypothetical protein ACIA8O_05440 [Kitasatospora sp. NPDC051853]|uniref:hypothetical protein n=1 Tax=Kitasatospora sp. NPDC051853 TaxID=3364058 RepID=UPI0037AF47A5